MKKHDKSTTKPSLREGARLSDTRDIITRDDRDSGTESPVNRDIITPEVLSPTSTPSEILPSSSSDSDSDVVLSMSQSREIYEESTAESDDSAEASNSDDEQSSSSNGRSFLSCCASMFCCGRNAVSSAARHITGRHRRTLDEQTLYEENCRRENGFNRWSAFSSLPVDTTGFLLDRALIQNSDNAVPVFAFVNLLRSTLATAVNIYFLCSGGDHPTGSRFSMASNISISILSLLLFGVSLTEIGVDAEHDDQTTLLLFLGIFINCLWAGIALLQSGELGFHSYNQTSQNTNNQLHFQRDEELGLADHIEHRPH